MKSRIVMVTLALLLMTVPASAQDPEFFGFIGQAIVPGDIGGMLSMYSIVYPPTPGTETPLPLDFDNHQYTLVITDLELITLSGGFGQPNIFEGGALAIYENDLDSADYGDPATFTSGDAILTGDVTTIDHIVGMFSGTVAGEVVWTGGTRFDELQPDYSLTWPLLATVSRAAMDVEPGYTEQWNGKTDAIIGSEHMSWSAVNNLMR